MLSYYFKLAKRSLGRNKVLTALMILTIAIGIGATMTTLTVYRTLSANPIPTKSDRLYRVQLDSYGKNDDVKDPPYDLRRFDAENLLNAAKASRQTITTPGDVTVEMISGNRLPMRVPTRYATADFFPMFEVPMKQGRSWTRDEDANRARVVVVSSPLAEQLFGNADPIGKTIRLENEAFQIIGVIRPWRVTPRYYDLQGSRFGSEDSLYIPFSVSRELNFGRSGNMDCNGPQKDGVMQTDLAAKCTWLQFWAELPDADAAAKYRNYLDSYSQQQLATGWFERPANTRLRDVMDWLDYRKAVPSDARLQLWLAIGFLLVCMINVVGLLLAKFLRRSGEIGVRRALGAKRGDIFRQFLTESALIGIAGGIGGLLLALLGLFAVRHQPVEYADLAHMDLTMLVLTLTLSVVVTLIAGTIPAWRAMRVTPAIQLKTQ